MQIETLFCCCVSSDISINFLDRVSMFYSGATWELSVYMVSVFTLCCQASQGQKVLIMSFQKGFRALRLHTAVLSFDIYCQEMTYKCHELLDYLGPPCPSSLSQLKLL